MKIRSFIHGGAQDASAVRAQRTYRVSSAMEKAAEAHLATMKERTAKAKLRDYLIDRVLKEIP